MESLIRSELKILFFYIIFLEKTKNPGFIPLKIIFPFFPYFSHFLKIEENKSLNFSALINIPPEA